MKRIDCLTFLLIALCAVVVVAPSRAAGGVHAGTPFPSDLFTVVDSSQNTGLRIDLPKPDCQIRRSDCEDLDLLNTLDGFNLLPRLSIPFDGAIDPATATSQTVFLISLDGKVTGINRIVWDPLTNTLHAESDELLDQHSRYALIVTNGLRDAQGNAIGRAKRFSGSDTI